MVLGLFKKKKSSELDRDYYIRRNAYNEEYLKERVKIAKSKARTQAKIDSQPKSRFGNVGKTLSGIAQSMPTINEDALLDRRSSTKRRKSSTKKKKKRRKIRRSSSGSNYIDQLL